MLVGNKIKAQLSVNPCLEYLISVEFQENHAIIQLILKLHKVHSYNSKDMACEFLPVHRK